MQRRTVRPKRRKVAADAPRLPSPLLSPPEDKATNVIQRVYQPIVVYLSHTDVGRLSRTSQIFRKLCAQPCTWKNLYREHFGAPAFYADQYKEQYQIERLYRKYKESRWGLNRVKFSRELDKHDKQVWANFYKVELGEDSDDEINEYRLLAFQAGDMRIWANLMKHLYKEIHSLRPINSAYITIFKSMLAREEDTLAIQKENCLVRCILSTCATDSLEKSQLKQAAITMYFKLSLPNDTSIQEFIEFTLPILSMLKLMNDKAAEAIRKINHEKGTDVLDLLMHEKVFFGHVSSDVMFREALVNWLEHLAHDGHAKAAFYLADKIGGLSLKQVRDYYLKAIQGKYMDAAAKLHQIALTHPLLISPAETFDYVKQGGKRLSCTAILFQHYHKEKDWEKDPAKVFIIQLSVANFDFAKPVLKEIQDKCDKDDKRYIYLRCALMFINAGKPSEKEREFAQKQYAKILAGDPQAITKYIAAARETYGVGGLEDVVKEIAPHRKLRETRGYRLR